MTVLQASAMQFQALAGRLSADPLPAGSGPCAMRVVRIGPGPRTPHRHPHSVELSYVVEGHGTAWEGDVASPVGPGDVVLVAQGAPHATVTAGPGDLVLVCFFPHPDLAANLEELDGPVRAPLPR
jgi:quercetin dioxygenase-like cupin family protein